MKETLYNQRFEDIYFSPEDGLAETRHVFLKGNALPERFAGRERFTICETGFGTGLNFLAAWQAFAKVAGSTQRLDYISFELYPLAAGEIRAALACWPELMPFCEKMLALYPIRVKGFHRIQVSAQIRLTLVFDDMNEALPQLVVPGGVDAWFLDGFAPSKNPQMWSRVLYDSMARLSAPGASAATFTVAGHVRRGLQGAGFAVEKVPGFGRKKEMTAARFDGVSKVFEDKNETNRIAVIGGGIAGTSCAYVLGQQGKDVTLFETGEQLGAGASGNRTGLYNPRFFASRRPESDFYASAYAQAVRTLPLLPEAVQYDRCGALHLVTGADKQKRFAGMLESGAWHEDHMRLLSAAQASEVAGVTLSHDALYLPEGGAACPAAVCAAYADGADVRLQTPVTSLMLGQVNGEAFDAVIVACAAAAKDFDLLSWLPLHTVRGQVSHVAATLVSARLKAALCYGGYIAPARDGSHTLGATFQKWRNDTDVKDSDHQENLEKLETFVPSFKGLALQGGKAGLRTASRDHFPLIGAACDETGQDIPGLYISAGHGSHGILSTLAGAHLLCDMICGNPYSQAAASVAALSPKRFVERAHKKQGRP